MVVNTSFPQKVFSSQIPDIILSADCTRVHVVISFANSIIYQDNLFPDIDNTIEIRELSDLVMPFARRALVAQLDVSLTAQNITFTESGEETVTDVSKSSLTTAVVYSTAEVSEDANTFCGNHFLSRLLGDKTTAVGRLEYLHYDSTEEASVTAYYDDGTTAVFKPLKVGGNGSYSTIDVSPHQFTNKNKVLYMFVVAAGNRSQAFRIDDTCPDAAPVLLFTNCFGCQELIYCRGTHGVSPDFKYDNSYIRGELRTYNVEEIRKFDADTGILSFPEADWAHDLFRSDEIYVVNFVNGLPDVGRRIVLTEAPHCSYTNDDDALPRFTFSYRYSKRNQNYIDTGRGGRVFDNTFDFTFN